MPTMIKKGTNASAFRLKNGKTLLLEPDILTVLSKVDFDMLMNEYGSFIKPRILTDRNPLGCFVVSEKENYASDMNKEVGKVKDGSSQIEVEPVKSTRKKKAKK